MNLNIINRYRDYFRKRKERREQLEKAERVRGKVERAILQIRKGGYPQLAGVGLMPEQAYELLKEAKFVMSPEDYKRFERKIQNSTNTY